MKQPIAVVVSNSFLNPSTLHKSNRYTEVMNIRKKVGRRMGRHKGERQENQ